MGEGNFRPPTESTPLDRSPTKLVANDYVGDPYGVPNWMQIRSRGASGRMNEILRHY